MDRILKEKPFDTLLKFHLLPTFPEFSLVENSCSVITISREPIFPVFSRFVHAITKIRGGEEHVIGESSFFYGCKHLWEDKETISKEDVLAMIKSPGGERVARRFYFDVVCFGPPKIWYNDLISRPVEVLSPYFDVGVVSRAVARFDQQRGVDPPVSGVHEEAQKIILSYNE